MKDDVKQVKESIGDSVKITFLGGAGEVGASSVLVRIKDKNILFDCGIRQGSAKDPLIIVSSSGMGNKLISITMR